MSLNKSYLDQFIKATEFAAYGASPFIGKGDKNAADQGAVDKMREGDVLLIAGKGHETGQEIGDDILPFDDREFVSFSLRALQGRKVW